MTMFCHSRQQVTSCHRVEHLQHNVTGCIWKKVPSCWQYHQLVGDIALRSRYEKFLVFAKSDACSSPGSEILAMYVWEWFGFESQFQRLPNDCVFLILPEFLISFNGGTRSWEVDATFGILALLEFIVSAISIYDAIAKKIYSLLPIFFSLTVY